MHLVTITDNEQAGQANDFLTRPAAAPLLAAAAKGNGEACHALGVAYSTAAPNLRNLMEAHKWFNIGAMNGHEESGWCRADIAAEMTRGEIAEAQRRAREWIGGDLRRAA